MVDRRDRDDIDAAFAAAADALSDEAAARRRKAAVLAAVRQAGLPGDRADAPATAVPAQPTNSSANDSSGPRRRGRSPVWGGLAAACVIGFGSLLVLRVNEVAPPDGTEPTRGSMPAAEPLAPNRATPDPTTPDRAMPQPTPASPGITAGVDSEVTRPGANPGSAAAQQRAVAPPLETNPPRPDPSARQPSQAPVPAPRLERTAPRATPAELAPPPAAALAEVPRQAPPQPADPRPAAPAAVRSFPLNSAESNRAASSLESIERATPMATADAAVAPPAAPVPARPPIAERARRGSDGAARAAGPSASLLDLGNDGADAQASAQAQAQGQARTLGQAQAQAKAESLAAPAAWRADGLIAAVEAGDLVRIRQLLQSQPADAEADVGGRSALIHAVQRANLPAVELLLAAGADPGRPDRQGKTALAHAAQLGNPGILAALRRR